MMKKLLALILAFLMASSVSFATANSESLLCCVVPDEEQNYLAPSANYGFDSSVNVSALKAYLASCFDNYITMIDISSFNIRRSNANISALTCLIRDEMVEYFNVNIVSFWGYTNGACSAVEVEYSYTPAEYAQKRAAWDATVSEILSGIMGNDSLSDVEKALLIHDRVVLICEYDYQNYLNGTIPSESYTPLGVFINRKAVCQGYAEAYMYLLGKVGIYSYLCSSDDLNHAWNIVYVDNAYYHVDLTWDDPVWDVSGRVYHNNFLRSSAAFAESHEANDYDTTPTSTKYDNYFWQDSEASFALVGDDIYYIDSENRTLNQYGKGTLCSITGRWSAEADYGPGYTWTGNYFRLATNGEDLFYSTNDAIYKFDLGTKTSEKIFAPTHSFGNIFSIFGFVLTDNTIKCELFTSPSFISNTKANYTITAPLTVPPTPTITPIPQPTPTDTPTPTATPTPEPTPTVYGISGAITVHSSADKSVTIRLLDSNGAELASSTTDKGSYMFFAANGTYTIEVSKEKHITATYTVTIADENVTQNVELFLTGDIDQSGTSNITDVLFLLKDVSSGTPSNAICDVDGNGTVEIIDVLLLLKIVSQ